MSIDNSIKLNENYNIEYAIRITRKKIAVI